MTPTDMALVNLSDDEDCEMCAVIADEPCAFHQGVEYGFAAATRLIRAVLTDPEIVPWDRVNRVLDHDEELTLADAVCNLGVEHEHTETGWCDDARSVARCALGRSAPEDQRPAEQVATEDHA